MTEILKTNVELGAIFLGEINVENFQRNCDWISEIHELQKELPIFIRTSANFSIDAFPKHVRGAMAGIYHLDDLNSLKQLIKKYIFDTFFPSPFVRGILEISMDIMESQFSDLHVLLDLSFIVKDRIIEIRKK